jgi:hypothetical protein
MQKSYSLKPWSATAKAVLLQLQVNYLRTTRVIY